MNYSTALNFCTYTISVILICLFFLSVLQCCSTFQQMRSTIYTYEKHVLTVLFSLHKSVPHHVHVICTKKREVGFHKINEFIKPLKHPSKSNLIWTLNLICLNNLKIWTALSFRDPCMLKMLFDHASVFLSSSLAYLAKGHVSFCDHLASIVHCELSHLNLLWNHRTELNHIVLR